MLKYELLLRNDPSLNHMNYGSQKSNDNIH